MNWNKKCCLVAMLCYSVRQINNLIFITCNQICDVMVSSETSGCYPKEPVKKTDSCKNKFYL